MSLFSLQYFLRYSFSFSECLNTCVYLHTEDLGFVGALKWNAATVSDGVGIFFKEFTSNGYHILTIECTGEVNVGGIAYHDGVLSWQNTQDTQHCQFHQSICPYVSLFPSWAQSLPKDCISRKLMKNLTLKFWKSRSCATWQV